MERCGKEQERVLLHGKGEASVRLAWGVGLLGLLWAQPPPASPPVASPTQGAAELVHLGPDAEWKVVEGPSGQNYYRLLSEDGHPLFHADYQPGRSSVTLGRRIPELRQGYRQLSWKWRAGTFPLGADERVKNREDSAGAVYLVFGSVLHRQSIKYVWSSVLPRGTVIGPSFHLLYDLVTVVLEGPADKGDWRSESVNVEADWKRFYAKDPTQSAPALKGLGLLTDGDDTHSRVSADYADFVLRGT